MEPARLTILGIGVPVLAARWLSGIGLLLSAAALALLLSAVMRTYRLGEPSRIKLLYGHLLVSTQNGNVTPGDRVVDVSCVEEIVRVAERKGETILHQLLDSTHHYFVQDGGLTFHYETPVPPVSTGRPDPESLDARLSAQALPDESPAQSEDGDTCAG
jgi:hypothetical protein